MNMSNHLRIATASISCFTDDGTLNVGEVNYLLSIALEDDNEVDNEEARVLGNVFSKISRNDVDDATWNRIEEVKAKYGIS